jgi:hypothetical protein
MTENEQIQELEKIARIARSFVVDARGSWETQDGNYVVELVDDYFYRRGLTYDQK